MTTKPTTAAESAPRHAGVPWIILLLVVGAGGLYAGMRWHSSLEQLIAPGVAASSAEPVATEASSAKQLWTCGMHPQVIQDHPGDCPICHMKLTPLLGSGQSSVSSPGGVVQIDPAVVQNMGVRIAEVTEGPLRQSVRVAAMLQEAEPGHHDVNLRVSGWIQKLYANTDGMEVKPGDPLFDLYSPDLSLAIEELISARKAATAVAAAASTEGSGPMSVAGDSLSLAATSRLLALGLTRGQVEEFEKLEHAPSVVTFLAPLGGHITEKGGVFDGSAVTAGQRIFQIAERTTMWIDGRVPQDALQRIHVGQKARATVDGFPGRSFDGEVIFIHPHFDEATRTALVRTALPNHDYALHEGMFASLDIDLGGGEMAVLVPREAIIDNGESQVTFVSTGDGHFEPRRVVMGRSGQDGMVQVLSGLTPGEHVVVSGQFLLDSESRMREAVAKFLGHQDAAKAPQSVDSGPRIAAPAARVDAVVDAYLALSQTLGAEQKDTAPLKLEGLSAALDELRASVAEPQGVRLIVAAESAAKAMSGQPIDRQRQCFKALSASVIALVDAMPPSSALAGSLYVANCPMAKADWLQKSRDIANPYYAQDMKECGSIVRAIGVKGAE